MAVPTNPFTGYKQDTLQEMAKSYGYSGEDLADFGGFLEKNPTIAAQYFAQQDKDMGNNAAMKQFQVGGIVAPPSTNQYDASGSQYPQGYYFEASPGLYQLNAPPGSFAMQGLQTLDQIDPSLIAPKGTQYSDIYPNANTAFNKAVTAPQTAFNKTVTAPQIPAGIGTGVPAIGEITAQRTLAPGLPLGGAFQAVTTPFEAAQNIAPATGQVTTDVTIPSVTEVTPAQTVDPTAVVAPQVTAAAATPDVRTLAAQAAQLQAPTQTIEAQQQAQSNIANIQAAQQAQAVQVQAPTDRTLQAGEVIAAPTGQAQQAAAFVEPVAQAVTAAPTAQATVQGQLVTLLDQFEGGEIPPWARGGVRAAQQVLLQRGLGASSIAGQAIIDAALEQALPIAQADARTVATFEAQNLTNRQQAAMVRAQYRAQFTQQEFDQAFQTRVQNSARVADIANRNFTSDQQIALENSRLTQTVDLANLNNNQAVTMAQAAALAQLDIANLNNRQQASVQNAQNFLQLDAANLSNAQQTSIFNSQQQVQSLLTDTAAENTTRQLNARNQQQSDQFTENLVASIRQNNTAQANAMNQFNAGETNALQRFNSEIVNQRDQFNARNQLAIDQSNAVWRREIATADTAAANFQNQLNAQNILNISTTAYANLWQEYRDVMEFAWRSGENEVDRLQALQLVQAQAQNSRDLADFAADRSSSAAVGGFVSNIFRPFADAGISELIGAVFGSEQKKQQA